MIIDDRHPAGGGALEVDDPREGNHHARLRTSSTCLAGRRAELRVLNEFVEVLADDVTNGSKSGRPALVLVGEVGVGKTALLGHVTDRARARGAMVLAADGCGEETDLPYAAITQLFVPALELLDELPAQPRAALASVLLAEGDDPSPSCVLHLGMLLLVRILAQRAPVLLVMDDVDRLDPDSLRALLFVARRLDWGDRVGLIFAGRGDVRPLPRDASLPTLPVGPLPVEAATALLDALPQPPEGRLRRRIVEAAEGYPLALEEYARAGTDRPVALSPRLAACFVTVVESQPVATRRLLLHAAVAVGEPLMTIHHAAGEPADDLRAWTPAEWARLVGIAGDRVRFLHPLVRSTVYALASGNERRLAHLALAAANHVDDHAIWHRAEACAGPDEALASELDGLAARAAARGDIHTAARALERAAECSPGPDLRMARYERAIGAAYASGDTVWVSEVYHKVRGRTDDVGLRMRTAMLYAGSRAERAQFREAVQTLHEVVPLLDRVDRSSAVVLAWLLWWLADQSGIDEHRAVAAQVFDHPTVAPDVTSRIGFTVTSPDLMWTLVSAAGDRKRADVALADALARGRAGPTALGTDLLSLGTLADRADDVRRSVDLLGRCHEVLHYAGSVGLAAGSLAMGLVEHGRWSEADTLIQRWNDVVQGHERELVEVGTATAQAALLALKGEPRRAETLLVTVRTSIELSDNLALDIGLRWAGAFAASVDRDRSAAFRLLRGAFTPEGEPRHQSLSPRLTSRLAAAASTSEERDDVRVVVARVRAAVGHPTSSRMRLVLHHADALLTDDAGAEHHYRLALADPTGDDWPIERATARLHYGEWLRRRRRRLEAQDALAAALDVFDQLGALPVANRVRAELRAAGSADTREATPVDSPADPLAELTSQQREIVRLAAAGLRNREIAERLYLSPRTVGSHLHHAYPKLGISGRHQLMSVMSGE